MIVIAQRARETDEEIAHVTGYTVRMIRAVLRTPASTQNQLRVRLVAAWRGGERRIGVSGVMLPLVGGDVDLAAGANPRAVPGLAAAADEARSTSRYADARVGHRAADRTARFDRLHPHPVRSQAGRYARPESGGGAHTRHIPPKAGTAKRAQLAFPPKAGRAKRAQLQVPQGAYLLAVIAVGAMDNQVQAVPVL